MNNRTLIGITAALIAVCALIATAMFPAARLASLPVAVAGLLVASSLFSAAGRLSTRLADLKGQCVSVQLWGVSPKVATSTVFRVHSIRGFGAGLHLWLECDSGDELTHLKIAQPKTVMRTAAEIQIAEAAYVQWAGRKMARQEDTAAVVLRMREPTAPPNNDMHRSAKVFSPGAPSAVEG